MRSFIGRAVPSAILLLIGSSVVGCVDELPVDVAESGVITVEFENAGDRVILVGRTDIVDLIVSLDGVRLTGLRARLEALDTTALTVRLFAELPKNVRDSILGSQLVDSLDATIVAELSALRRGDTSFRVRFDSVFGAVGSDTTVNVFIEERWQSVSAGVGHTCAVTFVNAFSPQGDTLELPLRRGGEVFCWGIGFFGALGTGSSNNNNSPERVRTSVRFNSVSAGGGYTCSNDTDGLLYCWGDNEFGALGIGNRLDQFVPRLNSLAEAFRSFDAGSGLDDDNTTCATTTLASETVCWGSNRYGQLGCGVASEDCPPSDSSTFWITQPNTARGVFVIDASLQRPEFSSVSVGDTHACGILAADGTAYCWGHNDDGELGAATTTTCNLSPCSRVAVPVEDAAGGPSALRFISLSAGGHFTCGVTTAGDVFCWGRNLSGQLGDGSMNDSSAPVPVTGTRGETFTVVDAGFEHACALTDQGRVYCWGENSSGQLGDGTLASRPMADSVVSDLLFGTMTVGDLHTCGITAEPFELRFLNPQAPSDSIRVSGEIHCWGSNSAGQLGDSTNTDSPLPVRVKEPDPFIFF